MHSDVTIVLMPETADPQATGLSTVLGVENASRSERNLGTRRLHECRPVFHNELANVETDSAKRMWFDDPSPSSEATAVFGLALGKKRNNISLSQVSPARFGVISAISCNAVRAAPWGTELSL
jgi:hypothetical protein